MLFNTLQFVLFFIVFFALFHFLARTRMQKLWLITVGSCLFYAAWDYRMLPLLLGTALADFFIARAMDREGVSERLRKSILGASIVLNLGVLAIFKYLDFATNSVFSFLHVLHVTDKPSPVLHLVLPIGISFYTFQSMSYTIDVYRRRLRARQHPIEFVSGVTFFPHLVAGPIIRATTLLPQFENLAPLRWPAVERAFVLVAVGLFKKTVADMLANPVARLFDSDGHHTALDAWTGALAFSGQIYGDFSGYTDIAIGVALLLGIELPPNFNLPYFATSFPDFWRRWHISFSSWLRDYLYIPLGGGRSHHYRNLMLTMLLGGLWHGANWTFVGFGAYHGLLLVITDAFNRRFGNKATAGPPRGAVRILQVIATFYLVLMSMVLFRARSFEQAALVFVDLYRSPLPSLWTYEATVSLVLSLVGLFTCHLIAYFADVRALAVRRPMLLWPALAALIAFAMFMNDSDRSFIYFQF